MKILVTAGNTMTMIDHVRAITNIFRGRTGSMIADACSLTGHDVTLLTSNPEISLEGHVRVLKYKTYDQLLALMQQEITTGSYELIIHSAAVSDYTVRETFVPALPGEGPFFGDGRVTVKPLPKVGKIGSDHKRLFLELVPTEKIIDKIRTDWGFMGTLVKFKLQVGISDEALLAIARKSRADSAADLIVANCLEWSKDRAYVIGRDDVACSVTRLQIAHEILRRIA